MNTIAEQIKNSINIEKEIPKLRDIVINRIKNLGEYSVVCDTHIKDTDPEWAIQYKYWTPICEWAEKEGLHTHTSFNNYGVKYLTITL